MAAGSSAPSSDRKLRRRLFLGLLMVVALLVVASHVVQGLLSYGPDVVHESGTIGSRPPRYGSLGLYLVQPPPRTDRLRVVLIGNSVYQAGGVVEHMQAMANGQGRRLELLDWSLVGAGLVDNLVALARAASVEPDLVVICFNNLSATADYPSEGRLPRFRTDCDQMVFDPAVAAHLPAGFYRRELDIEAALGSLVSTVIPLKRLDWRLRFMVDDALAATIGPWPDGFRQRFPLPTMNLVGEWLARPGVERKPVVVTSRPYDDLEAVITDVVTIADDHRMPVLMLRQETGPDFATPEIMPMVELVAAESARVFTLDLRPAFTPAAFVDGVHPREGESTEAYARRHLDAVLWGLYRSGVSADGGLD